MLPQIIVISLIIVPCLLILLFRSHAGIIFLALCAGVVFQKYSGADADFMLSAALPNAGPAARQAVNISLIGLPALVALVLQRKRVKGLKLIVGIIPALLCGVLLALSVMPHISAITRQNIMGTSLWSFIHQFEGLFVLTGLFMSLVLLKQPRNKDEKHKKHAK